MKKKSYITLMTYVSIIFFFFLTGAQGKWVSVFVTGKTLEPILMLKRKV